MGGRTGRVLYREGWVLTLVTVHGDRVDSLVRSVRGTGSRVASRGDRESWVASRGGRKSWVAVRRGWS